MHVHRPVILAAAATLALAMCREDQRPATPTAPQPPRLATASPTAVVLVGAGDIATCSNSNDEATAKLLDTIAGTVFAVGDNTSDGSTTSYNNCYNPTWGRHKARTAPAAGDKEYLVAGATPYYTYFGPAAGDPTKGYYSYELGDWHVVVVNSNSSAVAVSAGSAQEQWLKADLAASPKLCTVVYWHHPRFYSGSGSPKSTYKPFWTDLYNAGVELVLHAHTRNYERFAPQTPDGLPDPTYGVREIIVGTGGLAHATFGTIAPNSEVRDATSYGVLKLTLDAGSYSWEFVPVAGSTFTDSGSGTCHGAPPPVAKPGGPYRGGVSIQFDGSGSYDPQGDTPLTYAWDFGDGTSGSGATPTHAYAANGVYTVTLVVTDAKGNVSDLASTTATIAPKVDVGPDVRTHPGESVTLTIFYSDRGGNGPWPYVIAWGDGAVDNGTVTAQSGVITATHTYAALGTDSVGVSVTNAAGAVASDSLGVLVEALGTPEVLVGAGDIVFCLNNNDEATAKLIDNIPGSVFTFGDNAYENGTALEYQSCYQPTWGRHMDRTHAVVGNHEYSIDPTPTFDYFGPRIGPQGTGYYSFDLGDWHIIVLNDHISFSARSVQEVWLRNDLAASTKQCTLAIFHEPRFFSSPPGGATSSPAKKILWDDLYAAGAEVVLNGHYHQYERFAPQAPDGTLDLDHGIREFIVGTGGKSVQLPSTVAPNSEVRAKAFGVIKLTLSTGGYTWEFVPIAGGTFTDSGSGTCH